MWHFLPGHFPPVRRAPLPPSGKGSPSRPFLPDCTFQVFQGSFAVPPAGQLLSPLGTTLSRLLSTAIHHLGLVGPQGYLTLLVRPLGQITESCRLLPPTCLGTPRGAAVGPGEAFSTVQGCLPSPQTGIVLTLRKSVCKTRGYFRTEPRSGSSRSWSASTPSSDGHP